MTDRTDVSPRLSDIADRASPPDASPSTGDTLAYVDARTRTAKRSLRKEWHQNEVFRKKPAYRQFKAAYLKALYHHQFSQPGVGTLPAHFPHSGNEERPIVIYRAADSEIPFEQRRLCPKGAHMRPVRELPDLTTDPDVRLPTWVTEGEPEYHSRSARHRFLQTVVQAGHLRSANRPGFALSALELDEKGNVAGFRTHLCTQGESVLTSDVLGYELLKQRLSGGHIRRPERDGFQAGLRPAIRLTGPAGRPCDVMTAPPESGFAPLIAFQALVVFRNPRKRGKWCALVMDSVGAGENAPERIDLPPPGDLLARAGDAFEPHTLSSQCDLQEALISHLLESAFGDPQLARGCDPALSDGYQRFVESLGRERHGTRISLLGVVSDLETLRSTFSFLVVIEDEALLRHPYIVDDPVQGPYLAGWMRGSGALRMRAATFDELEKALAGANTFSGPSLGLLTLFSELTYALDGWLYQRYPDMPLLLMID